MINGELIIDNFAGGGGASTGIELATGRSVDIAINHDIEAIKMHKANHPSTEHYCEDVWKIDPVKACKGRPVALCWFSPDCKHFSKAKGGKPKNKFIRGLAWVALRWAAKVRPRVIMLENVEEFKTWGPLNRSHHPIKAKVGTTFKHFIKQLEALGYQVEFNELIAADYGAPTKRKRFFMIARCDGQPIVWPKPTYGPIGSKEVEQGLLKPYLGACTQIDFSMPCPSIFDTSEDIKEQYGLRAVRPLADNTLKRISRGLQKFVLDNPEPFIVPIGYGERKGQLPRINDIKEPLGTIVSSSKQYLCAPTLIQYHSETTKDGVRGQKIDEPILTVDGSNRYGLVSAFISKYYGGNYKGNGSDVQEPLHTVTTLERNALVTTHIIQMNHNSIGQDVSEPINTIVGSPGHFGEVRAFLIKYYGQGTGQDIENPLDTVTANDRFGLVTIKDIDYQIIDIGLRMLEPRELYGCQGFPEDYIIDKDFEGKKYPRSEQVKRCGNAVPPPFANALVRANLVELCTAMRVPNMSIKEETKGQLKFA